MQHTLLNKRNLPLEQCSVPVCFCRNNIPRNKKSFKRYTMPLEGCSVHSKCLTFLWAVSLVEKAIPLQDMQYLWHRASLSKVQYPWTCEHCQKMLFRLLQHSPVWQRNVWRSSILAKLANFCSTCVLFPLISPAFIYSGLKRQLSFKDFFLYYPPTMYSCDQISHSTKGMLHKIKQLILQGQQYPFKRALCTCNIVVCSNNVLLSWVLVLEDRDLTNSHMGESENGENGGCLKIAIWLGSMIINIIKPQNWGRPSLGNQQGLPKLPR